MRLSCAALRWEPCVCKLTSLDAASFQSHIMAWGVKCHRTFIERSWIMLERRDPALRRGDPTGALGTEARELNMY